jgi:hypothetical protein
MEATFFFVVSGLVGSGILLVMQQREHGVLVGASGDENASPGETL